MNAITCYAVTVSSLKYLIIKDYNKLQKYKQRGEPGKPTTGGHQPLLRNRTSAKSGTFDSLEQAYDPWMCKDTEYTRHGLESLRVGSHSKLQSIVGLGYLAQLHQSSVSQFYELYRLECLPRLSSLQNLKLIAYPKLHIIEEFRGFAPPCKASTVKDQSLSRSRRVAKCGTFEFLEETCSQMLCQAAEDTGSNLSSLESFDVGGCRKLGSVEGVEQSTNLEELDLSYCYKLHELPSLEHLSSLQSFIINGCRKLQSIKGLARLRSLQWLSEAAECRRFGAFGMLERIAAFNRKWSYSAEVTIHHEFKREGSPWQGCRILERVKHGERVKVRREWWDEGVEGHRNSIKKRWIAMVSEEEEGEIVQTLDKIFKISIP
eukprot:Gb_03861 [translate_table: standard]